MAPIEHNPSESRLLDNFTLARTADRHRVPGKGKGVTLHIRLDVYADGTTYLNDGANPALKGEPYRNDGTGRAWEHLVAGLSLLYERARERATSYQAESNE